MTLVSLRGPRSWYPTRPLSPFKKGSSYPEGWRGEHLRVFGITTSLLGPGEVIAAGAFLYNDYDGAVLKEALGTGVAERSIRSPEINV